MPTLVTCPACGGKVSTEAPACPHCGQPPTNPLPADSGKPKAKKKFGCGVYFLIGFVVFVVLAALVDEESTQQAGSSGKSAPITGGTAAGDLNSLYQQHRVDAQLLCLDAVKKSAKVDYRRIKDGIFSSDFILDQWQTSKHDFYMLAGDNYEVQLPGGAWVRVNYMCGYDPATRSLNTFDVKMGRLKR